MKHNEFSARKTFFNSAIYSFTGLLQKALSFFLLPLYTIYLKPEDYGLVILISTFFGFVALLITLALNGAVSRFYFIYKEDKIKLKQFLGTIITGVMLNSLFWFCVIFFFNAQITNVFLKNIEFYPYILIALVSTVTSPIYNIYQTILQIKQNAKAYSANSMLYFVLAVSLNLIFIVILKLGATGILLANAIPSFLFSFYAVINLVRRSHIELTFKWPYMKESLLYSLPLIPHILSGTIADYISKSFLYTKSNLTNVGLYNLAFQFGTILDVILSSINAALFPLVFNTLDNHRDEEKKLIKTITFVFKGITFLAITMALFSKELVFIMTSNVSYHKSWFAIPIISFGTLFYSLYTIYGTLLTYNKKGTRYFWIASVTGNLANIIITIIFTSSLLFLTPAIAGVVYKAIMFLIVFYISRKLEPVNYEIIKMMFIILFFIFTIAIGLGVEVYSSSENISLIKLIWKIFILLTSGIILFYEDRKQLKIYTNKIIHYFN